jgi:dipeptidyl aminopeptidase/acylaminoacyl peptidase
MTRLTLLLGALCASIAHAELRDEQFPVSAVLSAPFPTEIVAAADSPRLAFVLNDRGARNIWVGSAPDFDARQLTAYRADNGIEISDLQFAAGAEQLVFVRGGSTNSAGELPNPASLPQGGEQALYLVPVAGGDVRKLDDGAGPALHPSGDRVAYVKEGEVWQRALDDPEAEAEKLFGARGAIGDLAWSPDGSSLLFSSDRGTHSYVGIWTASGDGGEIIWLSPSLDRDSSPIWSPDGRRVAFLRLPTRDLDSISLRTGTARTCRGRSGWRIVATGASSEVWRAGEGRGSVYRRFESDVQLFWAPATGWSSPGNRTVGISSTR